MTDIKKIQAGDQMTANTLPVCCGAEMRWSAWTDVSGGVWECASCGADVPVGPDGVVIGPPGRMQSTRFVAASHSDFERGCGR